MMRYSVQPIYQIFVKGYEFLSFAKNMGKNIGKNISKNLSGKTKNFLTILKNLPPTDAVKTVSKKAIQKTVEVTGDLIGNKIPNQITRISITLQQNNSETVTNKPGKEIPKERYVSPEERQKIIDNLRLI